MDKTLLLSITPKKMMPIYRKCSTRTQFLEQIPLVMPMEREFLPSGPPNWLQEKLLANGRVSKVMLLINSSRTSLMELGITSTLPTRGLLI